MRLGDIFRTWRVTTAGEIQGELYGGLILNGALSGITSEHVGARRTGVLTTVVYGVAPVIDASLGNEFVVTVTDAVAFVFAAPTNPPAAGLDQIIELTIRNTSGAAHGAGTFNAVFKTSAAVPAIATANSRTFAFRWNGTNWVESFRSAADVAN